MSKIEVNKVTEILKKNQLEPKLLRQIVDEMNLITQPEADEDSPPAIKKQFCILISDPEGTLPKQDYVGWVLQIPEDDSPATVQDRIFRSVYDFNATKKGRLLPMHSVGEALECIQARHFKEAELWVKTKTPVIVLRTSNCIPMEEKLAGVP